MDEAGHWELLVLLPLKKLWGIETELIQIFLRPISVPQALQRHSTEPSSKEVMDENMVEHEPLIPHGSRFPIYTTDRYEEL
jgi:hypothetical protein